MKRNVALILIISLIACMLAVFVACNPAKIDKITGTYKLTSYSRQAKSDSDLEDLIEKRNITAYLVITSSGSGYFVYEDNDTDFSARTVSLKYNYDSDEPEKVSSIEVSDVNKFSDNKIGWYNSLRVNYQGKKECYLTYTKIAFGSLSPSSGSTTYERVDKATDLSYVQKQLGKDIKPLPNDSMARFHGMFELNYAPGEEDVYAYRFANVNVAENTVTIYSALKEDVSLEDEKYVVAQDKRSETTYPLSIVYDGGYQLSFAGYRFVASMNENNIELTSEVPGGPTQYMLPAGGWLKSLDELIENAINP